MSAAARVDRWLSLAEREEARAKTLRSLGEHDLASEHEARAAAAREIAADTHEKAIAC